MMAQVIVENFNHTLLLLTTFSYWTYLKCAADTFIERLSEIPFSLINVLQLSSIFLGNNYSEITREGNLELDSLVFSKKKTSDTTSKQVHNYTMPELYS